MYADVSHPLVGQLRPIFAELRTATTEALPSIIAKLDYIIEEEKDALFRRDAMKSTNNSTDATKTLANYLNQNLRDLFANKKTQKAGVSVIRSLFDVEYEDLNSKTKFFAELLVTYCLEITSMEDGKEAAEVLGMLFLNGSSVVEEIIANCLNFSIALLMQETYDASFLEDVGSITSYHSASVRSSTRPSTAISSAGLVSQRHHAIPGERPEEELPLYPFATKLVGCVFIDQLMRRVPSAVSTHLNRVLEALRRTLIDNLSVVRLEGAVTLLHTLQVAYRFADSSFCCQWQETFLSDIVRALTYGQDTILHGALVTLNALLRSITETKGSEDDCIVELSPYATKAIKHVWTYINNHVAEPMQNSEVKLQMLNALPFLAKYDGAFFKANSIQKVCEVTYHIFSSTEGADERPMMFNTLGALSVALPDVLPVLLDRIMSYIEVSLVKRPYRNRCPEAVTCFATISQTDPQAVRPFLRHILGSVFQGVITVSFAKDVAKLCAAFPELRSTCLSKILEATRLQLLSAQTQRPNVSPEETRRFIIDSLTALGSLDFTGYSTLEFLCDTVLRYVTDPQEEVRRSAIDLCFKLVHSGCVNSPCDRTAAGVVIHKGHEHICLVNRVISQLVNSAVSDYESDIRLHILGRLTSEYDGTLALQSIASTLFPALHDKHQNRIAAVRVLGRFSVFNPACVHPMLRRVMVQCVTDIQLFELPKKREQSTAVLSALVEYAPEMARPYVSSLLDSCVQQLRKKNQPPAMQTALLSCIGKLARYAEGEDVKVLVAIRPVVIHHILDSSNLQKKQEAIRALGDIIRTTKAVNVYETNPELLRVLLSALHGGFKETWPVRLDVLKLMGIIGAVNPTKVKEIDRMLRDANASNSQTSTDTLVSATFLRGEDAVAQTVVKKVLDVLQLPFLTEDQCICAVTVLANIFSLKEAMSGSLVSSYGDVIMTVLRHAREQAKIRETLLNLLTRIVSLLHLYVRPYMDEILSTVIGFLSSANRGVLVEVLRLLCELRYSLREEFRPYLPRLLPPITNAVLSDAANASEPVFAFFAEMGILLDEHLHNVLPCTCEVANSTSCPYVCRAGAVEALRNFASCLPRVAFHASRCVHCLCRILKEPNLIARAAARRQAENTLNVKHAANGGIKNGKDARLPVEPSDVLTNATLGALCEVAQNLGSDFAKFVPIVAPHLEHYGRDGREVMQCIQSAIRGGGRVLADSGKSNQNPMARFSTATLSPAQPSSAQTSVTTTKMNKNSTTAAPNNNGTSAEEEDYFTSLRNVFIIRDLRTEEDWSHWLRRLSVELLRCSPSPSHGFAYPLAHIHEPFAGRMLHYAFAVCFNEMDDKTKEMVTNMLGSVLRSDHVPSEVLQELLNLSEFMERLEMRFNPKQTSAHRPGLLFDLKTLMGSSERCNLYSKALHYVEIQFYEITRGYEKSVLQGQPQALPVDEWRQLVLLCEKSIYLCNLLGQRESAEGMLKYIQDNFSFLTGKPESEMLQMMDAQMLEKLQWWSQSLQVYETGLRKEPSKFSSMVGLMRSLDNLGDYSRLLESWKTFSPRVSKREAAEMAPFAAHAAWLLRRWDDMDHITLHMPDEGYIGTTAVFYRAVLAVRKNEFHLADPLIQLCRKRLDATLSALVAESYDRAYGLFVGIQQLSELEEIAVVGRQPQRIGHWQDLWEKRLMAMAYEGWPGTLANHTLVIEPVKEIDMWLRFVSLSRAHGRERTSSEVLYELLGCQSIEAAVDGSRNHLPPPAIALAAFQHLHDTDENEFAMHLLSSYLKKMEHTRRSTQLSPLDAESLAMCHSKLAYWAFSSAMRTSSSTLHQDVIHFVRQHLERATALDDSNGIIWHTWARFHHSVIASDPAVAAAETSPGGTAAAMASGKMPLLEEHIVAALSGYIRSIYLSQELEDVLGFLSLWFVYGSLPCVQSNATLQSELLMVSPTVWLKVIPQIIARLHSSDAVLSESVHQLLVAIATAHPQALLYNLNVTNTSITGFATTEQMERRKAAQRILVRIGELHPQGRTLVNDAELVCHELVRCAVLWTELWCDELDRAWFQWGKDQNPHHVLFVLKPLLDQLKTPETMSESYFVAEFGDLLYGACECVEKAASLNDNSFMEDAWNRFKNAVKRMNELVSDMSSLALQLVSPRLAQNVKDLTLVVPGQYNENGHFPRIASFQNTLRVMNSKQHPRRLYVNGTDGVTYKFLLKGHEDLRLDERVMQLLALVNTLLEKHTTSKRRDAMIQVFSATPLSDNAGLVGWVDHCNTLHQLIKEYRVHSKYLMIETNYMASFGTDLDQLTNIQRIEPFEYALSQTEGTDLANSMWMKAPSAEAWLNRRITYVCSLATMSMVGHILGLGDRHPSNLMIHAFSGRIVHIDFGDCFEVAQHRAVYPERVPFRLTRMLVKAMEMGGIEGLFRHGCVSVMKVLRSEGSSILALLEAFVHDPLVMWWRENEGKPGDTPAAPGSAAAAAGTESLVRRNISTEEAYNMRSVRPRTYAEHMKPSSADILMRTSKAQQVVNRIKEKLEGRDFPHLGVSRDASTSVSGAPVEAQVTRLIKEATANENLCAHYQGWCASW